jgi:hypothetical protein
VDHVYAARQRLGVAAMNATLFEMPAALVNTDDWRGETCWNCGKGFTAASWDNRPLGQRGARCPRSLLSATRLP